MCFGLFVLVAACLPFAFLWAADRVCVMSMDVAALGKCAFKSLTFAYRSSRQHRRAQCRWEVPHDAPVEGKSAGDVLRPPMKLCLSVAYLSLSRLPASRPGGAEHPRPSDRQLRPRRPTTQRNIGYWQTQLHLAPLRVSRERGWRAPKGSSMDPSSRRRARASRSSARLWGLPSRTLLAAARPSAHHFCRRVSTTTPIQTVLDRAHSRSLEKSAPPRILFLALGQVRWWLRRASAISHAGCGTVASCHQQKSLIPLFIDAPYSFEVKISSWLIKDA